MLAYGDCINQAVGGLNECADLLNEDGRSALFNFCLECVRRQEFRGWDWGWNLLTLASALVHDSARRALFESTLKDVEEDVGRSSGSEFYSQYELEQIALTRLALIERFEGSTAARAFLQSQAHLDRLRMMLIERSISEGNLAEAMSLIQSGIASSQERRLPGLTSQYRALQVNLLQAKGDKADLIEATKICSSC